MEKQIATIFYKKAHCLLLIFCLTTIYIKCDLDSQYRSFALIRFNTDLVTDELGRPNYCGAVWISRTSVLTAASCFDKKGVFEKRPGQDHLKEVKDLKVLLPYKGSYEGNKDLYKVDIYKYLHLYETESGFNGNQVILHPLYQRKGKMTLAFDFAVVNVDMSHYQTEKVPFAIANMCTQEKIQASDLIQAQKWVAVAVFPNYGFVLASAFSPHKPAFHAYVNKTKWRSTSFGGVRKEVLEVKKPQAYFIDPEKQFTMFQTSDEAHKLQKSEKVLKPYFDTIMDVDKCFGGPVLEKETGCVAGIMSFGAVKDGKQYITSTRVEPAIHWINYVLKNTVSDLDKSKYSFWEKKLGKEKLGSPPQVNHQSPEKSPGNPVSGEERVRKDIYDPPMLEQGKPGKNGAIGSKG